MPCADYSGVRRLDPNRRAPSGIFVRFCAGRLLNGGNDSPFMKTPIFAVHKIAILALAASLALPIRGAVAGARVPLEDSIKGVPVGASESGPHRVREALTAAESAETLDLVVTLRMRNLDKLRAMLESGRTVPRTEMEADFLPLTADYDRVATWLESQGFAPTLVDANHTNLFVRGTAAQIAEAFSVSFARVATEEGEFTSAVSPPSVPEEIGAVVLGIDGLQPHIRMHAPRLQTDAAPPGFVHPSRAIPTDVLAAYNVPGNLNGTGQTIGIWANDLPLQSDFTTFGQLAGITQNPAGFTVVPVDGGPLTGSGTSNEVAMDTEWSSGIAPGANVRIYAAPSGGLPFFLMACTQILNEGVVTIFTSSIYNTETSLSAASLQSASQVFAQMAAAGITIFHGAGDSGAYGASVAPEYPTTDPYVTALGGTTMTFDPNWNKTSETAWPNTGGGYSTFFSRPAWQVGPGVPAGTMRCVPDAAAPSTLTASSGTLYGLVVVNGSTLGVGGDSLTGPIWAGLTAIVNQARANVGLPTVGLLGPKIYPLIGTNAFNDITIGNNGAYSAGPGYDLCTGVGTPNVANLIAALNSGAPATITTQPTGASVSAGATVTLSAGAGGTPAPLYQWYLNGQAIPSATQSALTLANISTTQRGSYTVVATNGYGAATSSAANVTVSVGSWLYNISTLGYVGTGPNQNLDAGFYTDGSGSKNIVVRGIGPNLAVVQPKLAGLTLANPKLILNSASAQIATSTAWGGGQTLTSAFAAVYGAPFQSSSNDTAIFTSVPAGPGVGYTAEVTSANNGSGIAQIEAYDYDSYVGTPASHLINISTRGYVGTGAGTGANQYQFLDAGFWPIGSTSQTVLIRAVGPALAVNDPALSGQTLANPSLTLYDSSGKVIASNDGWGNAVTAGNSAGAAGIQPATTAIMNSVYASQFATGSNDCAMVVTLPANAGYTAEVTSADSISTGIALVEVYNLP